MITRTTKELAELVKGELVGDPGIIIKGVAGIKEAKEGDVAFLDNPKYTPFLETTDASCVIAPHDTEFKKKTLIRVDNPSLAFSKVINNLFPSEAKHPRGIHSTSVIDPSVKLGKDVAVGANAIIEKGTKIGDNTIIYGGVYIGHDCSIGGDALIYPNVTIREKTEIGDRVIIHSSTVIGSDGFGYVKVNGRHQKIPQVGIVVIEDDVEIGACVTVDRARFGKTVIGKGTKVDNLVQIAHNVAIGEDSIIISQAGISGSTTLGKNVILAGQAGIVGHIEIGDNVVVMAQSGVSSSIPPNQTVLGSPARPESTAKRIYACINMLPDLFKKVRALEKKIK